MVLATRARTKEPHKPQARHVVAMIDTDGVGDLRISKPQAVRAGGLHPKMHTSTLRHDPGLSKSAHLPGKVAVFLPTIQGKRFVELARNCDSTGDRHVASVEALHGATDRAA